MLEAFKPVAGELRQAQEALRRVGEGSAGVFARMSADLAARPGKGLRPGMFLLAARACGPIRPALVDVAAAIEMIHAASLVHDDVLDGAALRRDRPAACRRWGNRAAVLYGDLLFSTAFRIAAETGLPDAFGALARVVESLCLGEGLQVALGEAPAALTPASAMETATRKTACFFAEVASSGIRCAGGSEEDATCMYAWGLHFGRAYQVVDDVLDVVGDEKAEGKTLRSDVRLSRPTLPLALLLERAPVEARAHLPACDDSAAETLMSLMRRTGALADSLDRADDELRRARGSLPASMNGLAESFHSLAAGLEEKRRAFADSL